MLRTDKTIQINFKMLPWQRFMHRKVHFIWRSQQDHVPPAAQGTRPLRIPSCCRRGFITSNMNKAHPTPISGTGTAGGRVGVLL